MSSVRHSTFSSQDRTPQPSTIDVAEPQSVESACEPLLNQLSAGSTSKDSINHFWDLDIGSLADYSLLNETYNHDINFLNEICNNSQFVPQPETASPEGIVCQTSGTSGSRSLRAHGETNFDMESYFTHTPEPLLVLESADISPTMASTVVMQRDYLDQGPSPTKKRKLNSNQDCAPVLKTTHPDKHKWILFPALNFHNSNAPGTNRPWFSPCSSSLLSTFSETSVGITTYQKVTRTITNLLSEEYQASLPASWRSQVSENEESAFNYLTLPLRNLIIRE